MEKGRFKNLGEFFGLWVETTRLLVPEAEQKLWTERFFRELGDVCLRTRKKGEPPLVRVNELEGIDVHNTNLVEQPEVLAKIIKEASQIAFNAHSKRRLLTGVHDIHGVEPNFVRENGAEE